MLRQLIGAILLFLAIPQTPDVNAAFQAFWEADSTAAAAQHIDGVLATRVSFDEAYRRLKHGRTYSAQPTGIVRLSHRIGGIEYHFAVNVPGSYDATRKYQVRFQLHGGVTMRQTGTPPANAGAIGALEGAEQIYILPFAWDAAPWWSAEQVANLDAIVDLVKRRYNVDENRVVVSGVSDGATGAYYVAMRETTPFASFLPLNGFIMVLANRDLQVDGPLYPNNLRNKPFFVVNGGRDPLYPTDRVTPYVEFMRRAGVAIDYHPQPNGRHNTAWWPDVKNRFEAFVTDHPRNPLPDTLTWETAESAAHNRAHWLVIDALASAKGEGASLPDVNDFVGPPAPDFGVRASGSHINVVLPGSNAEKIGLKAGDSLVRLNDQPVRVSVDLAEAFETIERGTPITLLVARNNAPLELSGVYQPQVVTPLPKQMFDRSVPSGRVDLERTGNTVRATTRGVSAFTLLLSPDQFDFTRPVKVIVNGKAMVDRKIERDVRTLLKWAAADNDRTMLFGAELHVTLPRS